MHSINKTNKGIFYKDTYLSISFQWHFRCVPPCCHTKTLFISNSLDMNKVQTRTLEIQQGFDKMGKKDKSVHIIIGYSIELHPSCVLLPTKNTKNYGAFHNMSIIFISGDLTHHNGEKKSHNIIPAAKPKKIVVWLQTTWKNVSCLCICPKWAGKPLPMTLKFSLLICPTTESNFWKIQVV